MATCIEIDRVQYVVKPGLYASICRLYFCRHCLKLRSTDCVSHEVDSLYCPSCLESIPHSEAKLKKFKCANCLDCPSCLHTLSVRATTVSQPDPQDATKVIPKKMFYLACSFCRWTSRDIGLPDQVTASGGWLDKENPESKRIGTLLDYYQQLAQREKADKEKKKHIRRRNYLHFSDKKKSSNTKNMEKFGLGAVAARRRKTMMGMGGLSIRDTDDSKIPEPVPSVATTEVDELDEDIYTKPLVLTQVTTLKQRHACQEFQPEIITDLHPRHKYFSVKRSLRCRECEHNLSKPEFSPASIKFKIQLVALHHVPELRLYSLPNLKVKQETQVILTLFNPLDSVTRVQLLPHEEEGNTWSTAKVSLPKGELVLGARDDAAEFDDGTLAEQSFKDDPSVVVYRKANKLAFFVKVTANQPNVDAKISLVMKYDYRNMTSVLQSESKEPQTVWLQHPIYINCGQGIA